MSTPDRTHDIAVTGGDLRVGEWHPDAGGPPCLLVHGVTASHRAWAWLADDLVERRLIAPDLRGRGRSNRVAGPVGMAAHADDLASVLDALGIDTAVVVGHSMGAFVSAVFADRHPHRVERVILVDGGLPLALPPNLDARAAVRHVLGPTAERLGRRFADDVAYRDFWRSHPAFSGREDPELDAYFAYDLDGLEPDLRPATTFATVEEDSIDQNTGSAIADALERMPRPIALLAAERGLLDEVPPLYADLEEIAAAFPRLRARRAPDTNHYSIVMSAHGARHVAFVVRDEPRPGPG